MRRVAGLPAVSLAGLLISVAGCDQPVPPLVAVRGPVIDADDLGVLRGVLDDLRARTARGPFLVVDTTLAICAKPIDIVTPPAGGCLGPGVTSSISKVLPTKSRVTAALDFQARNAKRLPITGTLGDDVTFISATLTDIVSMKELIRLHPGGAVVTFTAPSYPGPRVAVIVYRVKDREHGAVRLERQRDERWVVADRDAGIE